MSIIAALFVSLASVRKMAGQRSVLVVLLSGFVGVLGGCGGETSTPATTTGSEPAAEGKVAPAPTEHAGKKIYSQYCFSCHGPGLNGAPKLGDTAAWAPRAAKGRAMLLQTTIEGIPPAMPPRGICMSCSDEELAAAIDYMLLSSQ